MSVLLVDVTDAVEAANAAYATVMRKNRATHAGVQKDRLGDNVIGFVGELIAAKYFRLPWKHEDDKFDQIDVAGKFEVRTRRARNGPAELPYRVAPDKEHPELPYVLVVITSEYNAEIVGWLYGHECRARAKALKLRPDPMNGVWYIPPPYRSLSELRKILWPSPPSPSSDRSSKT